MEIVIDVSIVDMRISKLQPKRKELASKPDGFTCLPFESEYYPRQDSNLRPAD